MTPLLVLSFVAGRRSNSQGRSHRLDQLQPEISLGRSSWLAQIADDAEPTALRSMTLEIEQIGSRITASGRSLDGTRHVLEGVVHGKRLCCISIDDNRSGIWIGTITVELIPGQQQFSGMLSRWSPQSQTMIVRPVTLTAVAAEPSLN